MQEDLGQVMDRVAPQQGRAAECGDDAQKWAKAFCAEHDVNVDVMEEWFGEVIAAAQRAALVVAMKRENWVNRQAALAEKMAAEVGPRR